MFGPLHPKNATVLVVDDNPDDALLIGKALEQFGIKRIFAAETAEEALAFLTRERCDIALADYNLPGMNGLRLLERVRELCPEVRLIVVTGARDERVAASAMKLGAVDYLPKDELLTSGIFRSLQGALRERAEDFEEGRRSLLSADHDRLEVAGAEAEWLLDSLRPSADFPSTSGSREVPLSVPQDEGWSEVVDAFRRYLQDSIRRFPALASNQEHSLVRKLMERDASPREVALAYQATLRALLSEGDESALSPGICLARVLARLVEQYQVRLSLEPLERDRA